VVLGFGFGKGNRGVSIVGLPQSDALLVEARRLVVICSQIKDAANAEPSRSLQLSHAISLTDLATTIPSGSAA